MLLNKKKDFMVAMLSKLQKSCFEMLGGFSLLLYKLSTQISMVSSRGVFVNNETSRLTMYKLESCWQIYSVKWNKSMTVYSFVVEGVKNFNKSFAKEIC